MAAALCVTPKSVAKVVSCRSSPHGDLEGLKDSRSHNGWRRNFSVAFAAKGCSVQSIDAHARTVTHTHTQTHRQARLHTHTHRDTQTSTHRLNRLGMIGSSDLDVHIAPWPRSYEPSEQQKHRRLCAHGSACTQYGRRQNH